MLGRLLLLLILPRHVEENLTADAVEGLSHDRHVRREGRRRERQVVGVDESIDEREGVGRRKEMALPHKRIAVGQSGMRRHCALHALAAGRARSPVS